jgi:hypothetical protein
MIDTISIGSFVAALLAASLSVSTALGAEAEANVQLAVAAPPADAESASPVAPTRGRASTTGFEAGLRVGAGVPLGNVTRGAGGDLKLSELTPWRAPLWVDTGYRVSEALTLGLYFQVGVGGSGDACAGACDWADVRGGIQAQWRPAGSGSVVPWIGVGAGYESLTFRTLVSVDIPGAETGEPDSFSVRVSESLGGPELLLQGGLDFSVEDSLWMGPYVSATLGQYISDGFECEPDGAFCDAGTSLEGSGLHTWLGVGLRGAYSP